MSTPETPVSDDAAGIRIIRLAEVVRKTGMSRSTIYQRLRSRDFPAPVELGPRAVGFVEKEVDGFLSELVRQRDQREAAHE